MTAIHIVDQITTAIEIFSAILLFFELIFVCFVRRRLMKSTFFQCFVLNGCYGLLSWAVSYQLLRSIGANSLPYLSFLMLLSGLSLHGYLLSSFLTSLNRFTAIVLPYAFDHVWKLQHVMLYFSTVILCSVLSVYFRIGVPIEAEWIEERQEYRWLGYPPNIHKRRYNSKNHRGSKKFIVFLRHFLSVLFSHMSATAISKSHKVPRKSGISQCNIQSVLSDQYVRHLRRTIRHHLLQLRAEA
ncbi:unnamed protein product [Cylicocyclus nassatus]|uniref:Uncharacterized protein n=1 Tax=Cylicocyclus nassatus TaxID=53992 RepID=A0AA36GF19_CYLNA|nr:unnamed protein product [Cylicocyclus nassatus]